eukprot:g151.t1
MTYAYVYMKELDAIMASTTESVQRKENLSNGRWFKTKRAAQKYEFNEFCTLRDKKSFTKIWNAGDICGNPISLKNLEGSRIYLLDNSEQVIVENCKGCEIFVGACCSTVFVRDSSNCKLYVATKQLYLTGCESLHIHLFSFVGPSMENSKKISFTHFTATFPGAFEAWARAGLYPFTRAQQKSYRKVNDTSRAKTSGSESNFYVSKPSGSVEDLNVEKAMGGLYVPAKDISPSSNPMLDQFKIGQHVEARYRGKRYWFRGRITAVPSSYGSKFDILYSDGDKEKSVHTKLIRVYAPSRSSPSFHSTQVRLSYVVGTSRTATWTNLTSGLLSPMGSATREQRVEGIWRVCKMGATEDGNCEIAIESTDKKCAAVGKAWAVTTHPHTTFVEWTVDFALGSDEVAIKARLGQLREASA